MKRMIIALILSAVLVGCGGGSAGSGSAAATKAPTPTEAPAVEEVDIDIDKCFEAMKAANVLASYDIFQDFYIAMGSNGAINISIVANEAADPNKVLEYTHMLIKDLNWYAQQQDPSIESSSSDSYGGLYDRYNALVGVSTPSTVSDTDKWLIYDGITTSTQFVDLK